MCSVFLLQTILKVKSSYSNFRVPFLNLQFMKTHLQFMKTHLHIFISRYSSVKSLRSSWILRSKGW